MNTITVRNRNPGLIVDSISDATTGLSWARTGAEIADVLIQLSYQLRVSMCKRYYTLNHLPLLGSYSTLMVSGNPQFSLKKHSVIKLTASKGFEARYFILSAIRVPPANRNTANAAFRKAAITCGIALHRTSDASSPS